MTLSRGLFTSNTDDWATPQAVFDELNREFAFTLDPCASDTNHKCDNYITREQDGLLTPWGGSERVFCNPPYGRGIVSWVAKCASHPNLAVMLVPARTDTAWFHDHIYGKAEVRFIRGRLKFGAGTGSAPFPSMVVVFNGHLK